MTGTAKKPRTLDAGTCDSCGAAIVWAETTEKKRMPLDAAPERRMLVVHTPGGPHAQVVVVYRSHFATCPNADQHRKPRAAADAAPAQGEGQY